MKTTLYLLLLFSIPFLTQSCVTNHDESQGEGPPAEVRLTPRQAAQKFFAAYRDINKRAALRVSNQEVVEKLDWNRRQPRSPNVRLSGDYIYDGDIVIELGILSDGHVGASVAEIIISY